MGVTNERSQPDYVQLYSILIAKELLIIIQQRSLVGFSL